MTKTGKSLRAVDKPFYRYWQALYLSFFSSKLYIDVAKRWKGFGFGYLLLVLAIVTLPFTIRVCIEFNKFFNEQVVQPINNLPTLYMQNGTVSVNEPKPYFAKNSRGQIIMIVDTTGSIKSIDNKTWPYLNILITKDRFFYRVPPPPLFYNSDAKDNFANKLANNVGSVPFDKQTNMVFNGKEWINSVNFKRLKTVIAALIYPAIVLTTFGIFLVIILTVGLMCQFIAKLFFDVSISYKQSCRLLTVSMTPLLLGFFILLVSDYFNSGYSFLLPILFVAYFCYAVICVKWQSKKLVHS